MNCSSSKLSYVVAALFVLTCTSTVHAQRVNRSRTAYNPVSGRTELDTRYHKSVPATRYQAEQATYNENQQEEVIEVGFHSLQDGCTDCVPDCGCGDVACCDAVCGNAICGHKIPPDVVFFAGFEATFLKPHVSNTAFTLTDNATASSTVSTVDFDYDPEFTPRVFVGWNRCGGDVGVRATWWQFDHSSNNATGNPPASGLGSLTHPDFGGVDISSVTPTDTFTALTDIDAYAIDIEGVKQTTFCKWQFGVSGGVRYASIEQGYQAQTTDSGSNVLGTIDYRQSIEGIGPTVAIEAYRPLGCRSGTFCKARGSLLFGDSKSRLVAGEDLTGTATTTTSTTNSDDILSIGELQIGYRWHAAPVHWRVWRPFYSVALEGQVWDGAGNATSQGGSLGFFGISNQIGVNW